MIDLERIREMGHELNAVAADLFRPGGSDVHDCAVRARDAVLWLADAMERAAALEAAEMEADYA